VGGAAGDKALNMPAMIKDYQVFLEILFNAWKKIPV
jgi:hypothetical protein